MLIFLCSLIKTQICSRKGMYKLPIMVYLDSDSIEAIAYDSNSKLQNENKDPYFIRDTQIDSRTKTEQFLGSIFNEVNQILMPINVQLHMIVQQPLNTFINCSSFNPLYTSMKILEGKHKDSTPFSKMFIMFCDNYAPYLGLKSGIFFSQVGKDLCTNHLGFIYVNNDILREKIRTTLLSAVSQGMMKSELKNVFYTKTCHYVNKCVDNRVKPVGMMSDYVHFIDHSNSNGQFDAVHNHCTQIRNDTLNHINETFKQEMPMDSIYFNKEFNNNQILNNYTLNDTINSQLMSNFTNIPMDMINNEQVVVNYPYQDLNTLINYEYPIDALNV